MAIFIWYNLGQAREKTLSYCHTVHVLVQPEIVIMKDTFWGWHFWSWAVSEKIMMLYQTFSGHRFGWQFRMPEVGYRYLAMLAGFDAANFAPNRSDFDVFPLNTPKNPPHGPLHLVADWRSASHARQMAAFASCNWGPFFLIQCNFSNRPSPLSPFWIDFESDLKNHKGTSLWSCTLPFLNPTYWYLMVDRQFEFIYVFLFLRVSMFKLNTKTLATYMHT